MKINIMQASGMFDKIIDTHEIESLQELKIILLSYVPQFKNWKDHPSFIIEFKDEDVNITLYDTRVE